MCTTYFYTNIYKMFRYILKKVVNSWNRRRRVGFPSHYRYQYEGETLILQLFIVNRFLVFLPLQW